MTLTILMLEDTILMLEDIYILSKLFYYMIYLQNCNNHCVCEDSKNNTFACIVQLSQANHMKYCEFIDTEVSQFSY